MARSGLAPSETISFESSNVLPGCVAPNVKTHPNSPFTVRDDVDGCGLDLNVVALDDTLIPTPTCGCSQHSIRSGLHRTLNANGEYAVYAEPAARTFCKTSNRLNVDNTTTESVSETTPRLAIGAATLEMQATCYPLQVEASVQGSIHAVLGDTARPYFWIGYVEWTATLNGEPYDTETGQASDTANRSETYGYGGRVTRDLSCFVVPAEQTAVLEANVYTSRLGNLNAGPYRLRVVDVHLQAKCREITSLAPLNQQAGC